MFVVEEKLFIRDKGCRRLKPSCDSDITTWWSLTLKRVCAFIMY